MLEARKLLCERDERVLFSDLSFEGQRRGVDTGHRRQRRRKTTLLRLLTGLSRPDAGEVCWQEQPLHRVRDSYHQNLLWIGHQPGIKTRLTALENLRFSTVTAISRNVSRRWRAGLAGYEDIPVNQLSAGQQRRVALARLWLTRATLWILDEPFTAIDVNGVERLTQRMAQHTEEGDCHPHHPPADERRHGPYSPHCADSREGRAMMWRIFRLELRVAFRHSAEIANPLWFFLIVITLFPLSIGPEPQLLARIAPGIIWVAALLASLLALERLFRDDLQDGSLEQLMLLPIPLPMVVLAKVMAHWMVTGLPLLILSLRWWRCCWGWISTAGKLWR